MRNAAAPFDDFALERPARKPVARKPRVAKAKRLGGLARTRYVHYAAVGLSAAVALGIVVNALALQHSRHPAPLFGQAIQLGQPAQRDDAVAAAPAAAPSPRIEPAKPVEPTEPTALASAPPVKPHRLVEAAPPAGKATSAAPTARPLKASATPRPVQTPPADRAKDGKTIVATQRALSKLGFAVKATGSSGAATRSAIEAFERDRHLPVKGEMSRKLLKQLSAESGIAID